MKIITTLLAITTSLITFNTFADDSSDIESVILENLHYTQQEDIEGVMSTMHSQSPSYLPTKSMLISLFPEYDLQYELVKYTFVASDDDYAYARVLQRTSKVSGPAFQNNEIDALQVYKKEGQAWKLWSQANLDINFL